MVLLAAAVAVAGLALSGCSGTQARSVGCSKDTDCRDPRICERGACVDPHSLARGDAGVADGAAVPAPTTPPFAMFGGDARHTGRRGGPAPAKAPAELWSVDVHGPVS